jgi:hypothetical protein
MQAAFDKNMALTYSIGGTPLRRRRLRLRPSPPRGHWRLPDHPQQQISLGVPALLSYRAVAEGRRDGPTAAAAADPADAAIVVRVLGHSRAVTGSLRRPDRRLCANMLPLLLLLLLLLLYDWGGSFRRRLAGIHLLALWLSLLLL